MKAGVVESIPTEDLDWSKSFCLWSWLSLFLFLHVSVHVCAYEWCPHFLIGNGNKQKDFIKGAFCSCTNFLWDWSNLKEQWQTQEFSHTHMEKAMITQIGCVFNLFLEKEINFLYLKGTVSQRDRRKDFSSSGSLSSPGCLYLHERPRVPKMNCNIYFNTDQIFLQ